MLGTALRNGSISHVNPVLDENLPVDHDARSVANQEGIAQEPLCLDERASNSVRGDMAVRRRRYEEDISSFVAKLVARPQDRHIRAEGGSGTAVPNEKNGLVVTAWGRVGAKHIVSA